MLSLFDFLLLPIYLFIIGQIAGSYQKRKSRENPVYKYFVRGLMAKIGGGILLCIIYTQYYQGGDTTAYFESSTYLFNLMFKHPDIWAKIMMNDLRWENYFYFDSETGYPGYYRDPQSFTVVRLTWIFHFLSLKRYLFTTVLLASVCYLGVWRLFLMFNELYPGMQRAFSFSVLFIPSVLFWGSGVLKDSYTLSAACWFTYSFYRVFIMPKKVFINLIMMVLTALLITQIKPYIFLALLPGSFLWLTLHRLKGIQNAAFRFLIAPVVGGVIMLGGYLAFTGIQQNLSQYSSIDKVLEKAVVTQQDLKQDYYQGNSFDIGEFDNSITGILSKFPVAFTAGLFRPFLWEANNPVMLIAGLENAFMLGLTLFILFRIGPVAFVKAVSSNPMLFFSLIFAIFFSFSVGLTTANFGALVRYKIPALPYYISSILIMYNLYVRKPGEEDEEAPKDNPEHELNQAGVVQA